MFPDPTGSAPKNVAGNDAGTAGGVRLRVRRGFPDSSLRLLNAAAFSATEPSGDRARRKNAERGVKVPEILEIEFTPISA
jgi:hypothetical protein